MRDALERREDVEVLEINTDEIVPAPSSLASRIRMRLFGRFINASLERAIVAGATAFDPTCIIFYKGSQFGKPFLRSLKRQHYLTVNIYPDCSPFTHGRRLAAALGEYDLVISTKPYHPGVWNTEYGYANDCVFVPHGYDASCHLRTTPPTKFRYDVAIAASGRPEYHAFIRALANRLGDNNLRVAIAGSKWQGFVDGLPTAWQIVGPKIGDDYIDFLRQAKICLAPVQLQLKYKNILYPGDVDSTRTYEIAASYSFMIHRKTDYVQQVYDSTTEAPTYDSVADLADKILFYLNNTDQRQKMAAAAHARAVPAYSVDQRASQIVSHLKAALARAGEPKRAR